jgi:hypothetical protein
MALLLFFSDIPITNAQEPSPFLCLIARVEVTTAAITGHTYLSFNLPKKNECLNDSDKISFDTDKCESLQPDYSFVETTFSIWPGDSLLGKWRLEENFNQSESYDPSTTLGDQISFVDFVGSYHLHCMNVSIDRFNKLQEIIRSERLFKDKLSRNAYIGGSQYNCTDFSVSHFNLLLEVKRDECIENNNINCDQFDPYLSSDYRAVVGKIASPKKLSKAMALRSEANQGILEIKGSKHQENQAREKEKKLQETKEDLFWREPLSY